MIANASAFSRAIEYVVVPTPSSAVTVILTEFVPSVGVNVFAVTALPLAVYSVTDAKLSVSVGTNVTEVTGLATVAE